MTPLPAAAWTQADQAELDLLTWELVHAHHDHRSACPDCQALGRPCERLAEGTAHVTEMIVAWRDRRIRATTAEQARQEQDRIDEERAQARSARRDQAA
jgi:PIN domain nuclease of toxin-antitoxin system